MKHVAPSSPQLLNSRRRALKLLGGLGVGVAFTRCGAVAIDRGDAGVTLSDGGSVSWAVASGSALAGKNYGNPFASGVGSTCAVYKASTGGPCHSNTFVRSELTEGLVGLPTRLELLVVNASCQVVPNATVEVWHASPGGVYSGAPVNGVVGADLNTGFCTNNNAAALAAGWLRGTQTTGADGRVTFDTVFPGWYSGRTWHVHFKVSVGSTSYVTSQLFADEALKTDVFSTHSSYNSRPVTSAGYVTNASDMVIAQAGLALSDVVLSHAAQSDGSLLMWKAIALQP